MEYSAGVSGGPNLYDIFRAQRQLAMQQASTTGTSGASFTTAANDGTSTSGSASSATAATTTAPSTQVGTGGMFSSSLASLLMQFQNLANPTSGSSGTLQPATAPISQSDFEKAFTAQADQAFAKLDTNGDGTISQSEAQSALQTVQQAPQGHHGHHHHHGGDGAAEGAGATSSAGPLEQLLQADASGGTATSSTDSSTSTTTGATGSTSTTGQISQSDFENATSNVLSTSQADQLFAKIDKNGNGTIDQSEAQNALKHHHHARNAQGMQSPIGTTSSGGQGSSPQSMMSGLSSLLFAQQMGQAA
ncbi:MAG: EF-hand domain-containing protein [Alphaproteobacteria bacterium]|nr:EF-hand domain-containing protein [Alphaproteobacteria bacterium]